MYDSYTREEVEAAFRIYLLLQKKGELRRRDFMDLFEKYSSNPKVRDIFVSVFEPMAEAKVLESEDVLYLVPEPESDYLSYNNEQLRELMRLDNNTELYCAYFVILCLLSEFFGADFLDEVLREYILVKDLERVVSASFESIEPHMDELEVDSGFNLRAAYEHWKSMEEYRELERMKASKTNRYSFILRVCSFLQSQGLVNLVQEREIYITRKTELIVRNFYAGKETKEKLLKLISGRL